jgi:hypothetical protein
VCGEDPRFGWFTIRQRVFVRGGVRIVGSAFAYDAVMMERGAWMSGFAVRFCITAPARFISLHQGLNQ